MNHLPKSNIIYLSLIYVFPLFISNYLHPQDEKFTIKEPYQIVSKNDLKDIVGFVEKKIEPLISPLKKEKYDIVICVAPKDYFTFLPLSAMLYYLSTIL
jgi:hypothetical protein